MRRIIPLLFLPVLAACASQKYTHGLGPKPDDKSPEATPYYTEVFRRFWAANPDLVTFDQSVMQQLGEMSHDPKWQNASTDEILDFAARKTRKTLGLEGLNNHSGRGWETTKKVLVTTGEVIFAAALIGVIVYAASEANTVNDNYSAPQPQPSYASGYTNPNVHWVQPSCIEGGTLRQGHWQTNPNDTLMDNFSTKGNVNPYTGKPGTVDPSKPKYNPYPWIR